MEPQTLAKIRTQQQNEQRAERKVRSYLRHNTYEQRIISITKAAFDDDVRCVTVWVRQENWLHERAFLCKVYAKSVKILCVF